MTEARRFLTFARILASLDLISVVTRPSSASFPEIANSAVASPYAYTAHHCGPVGRSTPQRHRGSNHQRAQRRKARRTARVLRRVQG